MVLQNFIVLGIIPGTDIQINFLQWLLIVVMLVTAWRVFHFIRTHHHKVTSVLVPTIGGDLIITE